MHSVLHLGCGTVRSYQKDMEIVIPNTAPLWIPVPNLFTRKGGSARNRIVGVLWLQGNALNSLSNNGSGWSFDPEAKRKST